MASACSRGKRSHQALSPSDSKSVLFILAFIDKNWGEAAQGCDPDYWLVSDLVLTMVYGHHIQGCDAPFEDRNPPRQVGAPCHGGGSGSSSSRRCRCRWGLNAAACRHALARSPRGLTIAAIVASLRGNSRWRSWRGAFVFLAFCRSLDPVVASATSCCGSTLSIFHFPLGCRGLDSLSSR